MMSSLKCRMLLALLKAQTARELSRCCACLARSRFNLTGNFKYALQQQEDYRSHDANDENAIKHKSSRHRKEHDDHLWPGKQRSRVNYLKRNDQEGSLVSSSDQKGALFQTSEDYPNPSYSRYKSEQESNFPTPPSKWQLSNNGESMRPRHNLGSPLQPRLDKTLLQHQSDPISQEESEIPVLTKPVKSCRPSTPKAPSQARFNKSTKRKFRIVSGDLTEAEKEAHKKQFPDKRKQSRIADNTVEIAIDGEVVFGIHPVLLALKSGRRSFHKLFLKAEKPGTENIRLQEICDLASQTNVQMSRVPGKILEQLSGNRPHQGVCLDASILKPEVLNWAEAERMPGEQQMPCLWLLLDKIVDPMNLGAILRSSYYFGVNRIVTTKNSCRLSPVVSKASSGALEVFPPYVVTEAEEFLTAQAARGWDVVGTCVEANVQQSEVNVRSVMEHKLTKPTVLIIGNEGNGLEPKLSQLCSCFLTIYPGQQHSEQIAALNVGVAAGIILHSLLGRTSSRKS